MNMKIIVQVIPEAARELGQEFQHAEASEELLEMVNALGFSMNPLHPDTKDSQLRTYFTIDVPDEPTAELVINRLLQSRAIAAAYVKPADEMPG